MDPYPVGQRCAVIPVQDHGCRSGTQHLLANSRRHVHRQVFRLPMGVALVVDQHHGVTTIALAGATADGIEVSANSTVGLRIGLDRIRA